ncbi:MAG: MFS transporter, partial [Hyphomonadaceae bacterium]
SLLVASAIVGAIGNAGLQSVLPAIGRKVGIPDALIAGVFAVSSLMFVVTSPFWARISDRTGRKAMIILGAAGLAASMALSGVAVSLGIAGVIGPLLCFAFFVFGRSFNGIFGAASMPASQAYVAERTDASNRTRAISTIAGAFGFGMIFGPMISPFFVLPYVGLAGPLYAYAAFAIILIVAVIFWLPERPYPVGFWAAMRNPFAVAASAHARTPSGAKQGSIWFDKRIQPFLIFAVLANTASAGFTQTIGFVVIDTIRLEPEHALPYIAGVMTLGAVLTVAIQWGLIPLISISTATLMRWGSLISVVGCVGVALSTHYWHVLAGFGLFSIGQALARPGNTSGMSLAAGPEDQARIAGAMGQLGGTFGLGIFFVALYSVSHPAPYWACSAMMVGLAVYAYTNRTLAAPPAAARAR